MNKIYFSNVWEEYETIKKYLKLKKEDVFLSICSSGDNCFNSLLEEVSKVICIDLNPNQIKLAKYKKIIFQNSSYNEIIKILEGPIDIKTFKKYDLLISKKDRLSPLLSKKKIKQGLNNSGEFERKIVPIIRFWLKLFIQKNSFSNLNLKKQHTRYKKHKFILEMLPVNTLLNILYRIRLPNLNYDYISLNLKDKILNSLDIFFKTNDITKNYLIQKIYFKKYKIMPPYLRKENFNILKNRVNKLEFITGNILNIKIKQNSIDKINLSNIFEWTSHKQYENIILHCSKMLKTNGRLLYKETGAVRIPTNKIKKEYKIVKIITNKDAIPLYDKTYILEKI